jgi:hypothetical protein
VHHGPPIFAAGVAGPKRKHVVAAAADRSLVAADLAAFGTAIEKSHTDSFLFSFTLTICHEKHLFLLPAA